MEQQRRIFLLGAAQQSWLEQGPKVSPSKRNPVIATEFCGTAVTSSSPPQARTQQYVAMNPHAKYGRSDKRGFMLMEITPARTSTVFVGLDDVRDVKSGAGTLASFAVDGGAAGAKRLG